MTHRFPVRVYYEDTDMGGIVYHANYLKFIERARSDFVRELGVDQNAMRDEGQVFVVRRIECDYLAPTVLDDALIVETEVAEVSRTSLVLTQRVLKGEKPVFEARVVIVTIAMGGRPVRLPAEIRQIGASS